MTRDEAQRRARLAIGGVEQVKEECREARGVAALESTVQDVHYGLRQLHRRPGFAAVVVTSLALGIGANTAIFTLIDAVLLRMLPVHDPAGLQLVFPEQANGDTRGFEYPEFRRLRAASAVFVDVAAYGTARLNVSLDPGGAASSRRPKDSWFQEATFRSSASTPWPDAPLAPKTT